MTDDKPDTGGAYATFTGDSGAVLTDLPELGDIVTFTVRAKTNTDKEQERKDGEIRRTFGFHLLDVVPGAIEKAPRDEPIEPDPALFEEL